MRASWVKEFPNIVAFIAGAHKDDILKLEVVNLIEKYEDEINEIYMDAEGMDI